MYIVDNKGRAIRLSERNFLAEGGEGKLYASKDRVYKIYIDENKVIPEDKITDLGQLTEPAIIRPLESIYKKSGKRIGFSMQKINNPVALARTFTTGYWNTQNITPDKMIALVKTMQKTISFIHKKGFLQVDGNEFNYMVNSALTKPYFIDVDSFQTPNYPATAIMPSIRDYTQNEFNVGTDWFSFSIVAFQMMTGIHPFKGLHADFKKGDFEGRIKAGVSVFNKDVSYPSSTRDFSIIPKEYLDWFNALFVKGERIAPPDGTVQVAGTLVKKVIKDGKHISIKKIATYDYAIRRMNVVYGQYIISAGDFLFVGKTKYQVPGNASGVFIRDNGNPLFTLIENNQLSVIDGKTNERIDSGLEVDKVFVIGNIPYVIRDTDLIEINIVEFANKIVVSAGITRKVLPNATQVYNGIIVQNVLGKTHLMIPAYSGFMPVIAIPELDRYKFVDANYENHVVMASIADNKGEYRQARIRFNSDFTHYDIDIRDDIDYPMNFAVLDKGVIISIPGDGTLEITPNTPESDQVRIVEDKQVVGNIQLINDNGRLGAFLGSELYALRLK